MKRIVGEDTLVNYSYRQTIFLPCNTLMKISGHSM